MNSYFGHSQLLKDEIGDLDVFVQSLKRVLGCILEQVEHVRIATPF
jgi:hypothetical protein